MSHHFISPVQLDLVSRFGAIVTRSIAIRFAPSDYTVLGSFHGFSDQISMSGPVHTGYPLHWNFTQEDGSQELLPKFLIPAPSNTPQFFPQIMHQNPCRTVVFNMSKESKLHPHGTTRPLFASKFRWHLSFLERTVSPEEHHSSRLLYSYSSAMEGFAAMLSESEMESLQKLPDVVAIRPDMRFQLQTTYSYKFLGLGPTREDAWYKSGFGRGVIIGVLDTGVWPESPSFSDRGMPPVPKKWRGICQEGQDFSSSSCNRKLIGARFFTKGHRMASTSASPETVQEYASPRDSHGHGTHTTSTAGGVSVPTASVLGLGSGVARGMAPGAHIAVYKVCWFSDTIAIGSFRAMEHGISVVCAAGNNGPIQNSVSNEAPWIATIGASTLDRKFPAIVQLESGQFLYGESMYPGNRFASTTKELELVYVTGGDNGSEFCFRGSLPREKVQGKMVVCDRGVNGRTEKGLAVKESGGAAMILANTAINLEEDSVDVHVLPATLIGFDEAVRLKAYINSTSKPGARIVYGGTVIGKSRAPAVAQFSARGPSYSNPSILKPDVIAPGVNIIAAWPQNLGPSSLPEDPRRTNFHCHVRDIHGLSPYVTDHAGHPIMDGDKPAGVFAIGAGHVNPERALGPGLVYDIRPDDYVTHLCTLRYTRSDIFTITHRNVSCNDLLQMNRGFSLNYPSISIIFKHGTTSKMIKRQVTNVGSPNSIYSVEVSAPEGVKVRVRPQRLVFKHVNQSLSYKGQKPHLSDLEVTWAVPVL
ncbi:SUBTILISIN-LIKE PROTEASE SBT1.2 [Salix viminalis]|uniref:SUBTILISIN-LIKE PROTEASE SBT1.2 n=1 Tax=Salix viminalis TaxID=40686 RepID=A0A9Q0UFC2_SALVM|nr:SUBTILISIN-LIKE PROTEASE SBT1.2 [Salix viminalis]